MRTLFNNYQFIRKQVSNIMIMSFVMSKAGWYYVDKWDFIW